MLQWHPTSLSLTQIISPKSWSKLMLVMNFLKKKQLGIVVGFGPLTEIKTMFFINILQGCLVEIHHAQFEITWST